MEIVLTFNKQTNSWIALGIVFLLAVLLHGKSVSGNSCTTSGHGFCGYGKMTQSQLNQTASFPSSLTRLFLENNNLTSLPENIFHGLGKLRNLFLKHNLLQSLPAGVFNGLVKLDFLYLSYNKLHTLRPDVFKNLKNLKKLILRNNSLIIIPEGVFTGLIKLDGLDLSNNKLQTLPPKIFQGLSGLRKLDLQQNKLQSLRSGVFLGLALTRLFLDNNELNHLPGDVFAGLHLEQRFLSLSGNPWDCGMTICNSWLTQEITSKFGSNVPFCANGSLLNKVTELSEMPRICRLSCPSISDPANGRISTGNTTYGTTRTFQCNDGFKINGSTSTTCQGSQTWSSPLPSCISTGTGSQTWSSPLPSCTSTASGKSSGWSCSKDLPVVYIGLSILTVVFSKCWAQHRVDRRLDCDKEKNETKFNEAVTAHNKSQTIFLAWNDSRTWSLWGFQRFVILIL